MQQQTTFTLDQSKENILDEFIESDCNRRAYQRIMSWPKIWGVAPYARTVILTGRKSSGKSFLANIWAKRAQGVFIHKNTNLSAETISSHQGFVIDNFDETWDEEEVLHHFNILHENQKYFLITLSDFENPKLADLDSRLKSCSLINIELPDDELIKIFIFKLFSQNSVLIDHSVIDYLAKILPRDFAKIQEHITMLNEIALRDRKKITIPFVKGIV